MCIRDREKGHAVNTLSGVCVDLVQQDAGECLVGHSLSGDLPILYGEVDGCGVQFEGIRAIGFHGIVVVSLQGQEHFSILPGGHGVHQSVVADAADLKRDSRDGLCLISLIDFGKLHTAYPVSYTHLGQGQSRRQVDAGGVFRTPVLQLFGDSCQGKQIVCLLYTSVRKCGPLTRLDFLQIAQDGGTDTAVSYTHLDVYKRQPVMRVRISLVKVITIPPAMVSIPLAR